MTILLTKLCGGDKMADGATAEDDGLYLTAIPDDDVDDVDVIVVAAATAVVVATNSGEQGSYGLLSSSSSNGSYGLSSSSNSTRAVKKINQNFY